MISMICCVETIYVIKHIIMMMKYTTIIMRNTQ